jgi:hypothetical protein
MMIRNASHTSTQTVQSFAQFVVIDQMNGKTGCLFIFAVIVVVVFALLLFRLEKLSEIDLHKTNTKEKGMSSCCKTRDGGEAGSEKNKKTKPDP